MLERIIKFIENNPDFVFFKLLTASGDEVYQYEVSDADSFKEEISNDFENLEPGSYKLRGTRGKQANDKAAKFVPFTIQDNSKNITAVNQKTTAKTTKIMENVFTLDQVKEMLSEAKEQGKKEAEIDFLKREFQNFKTDFEAFKIKVAKKFDELDGVEDNDLLTKVTNGLGEVAKVAPHIPAIAESMKSFSLK